MKRTLVFFVSSLLLVQAVSAIGNAPESVAGRSCNLIIAEGDGVIWSEYGTYRVDFSPTGNTYAVVPISPNILPSAGTYSYTKTGPNTAEVTFTDGDVGIAASGNLVFSRPSTGHYNLVLLGAAQFGILVFETPNAPTGDRAPNSVAGRSVMAAIKSGSGVYAPYGGFRVEFGLEDLSYTLSPYSPSALPTAGTYTYSKNGANTATVSLTDSSGLLLTSSFNLAFTSSAAANFAGGNSSGSQDGVLFFESGASPSAGASGGNLVNMSVRAVIEEGSRIIPGFVVEGGSAKVLIRAGGPALAGFGVEGAMINPRLSVYSGDTRMGGNAYWSFASPNTENVIDAASKVGAFQFLNGSDDAALVLTLEPGPYTAIVDGWDHMGGEVLLEVYSVPED